MIDTNKIIMAERYVLDGAVAKASKEGEARIEMYKHMMRETQSEEARQAYQFFINGVEFVLTQLKNNLEN